MDFDTKIVGKIAITNHGKTGFYFLTLLTSSIVTTLVALQRIDKNRHADRDGVQLSEKDRARAKALVEALDGTSIDAIYSPSIRGNLYIAAPLTTARGMEIKRTNAFDPANAFLDVVAASAGQTIVWVGNMDNLSPIWKSLALDGPPPLAHGDLFIVESVPSAMPKVTRRRFGSD